MKYPATLFYYRKIKFPCKFDLRYTIFARFFASISIKFYWVNTKIGYFLCMKIIMGIIDFEFCESFFNLFLGFLSVISIFYCCSFILDFVLWHFFVTFMLVCWGWWKLIDISFFAFHKVKTFYWQIHNKLIKKRFRLYFESYIEKRLYHEIRSLWWHFSIEVLRERDFSNLNRFIFLPPYKPLKDKGIF